jgi:hypothetical protein
VYEDEEVLLLFKPAGITVQGSQGSTLEQLVQPSGGAHFVSDPECWRQREQKGVSGDVGETSLALHVPMRSSVAPPMSCQIVPPPT